ncbi:MAG: RNA polymerase sigma factor [Bacteroidota bacterium]|jgi:RNA polymerase sigma factor (sigma-70 family)
MTASEYNTCVDLYADGVFRFVLKNTRDQELSRDVVQDTFEKLWVKAHQIEFATAKSYLFTAAYHTMIDAIRKDKKHADIDEGEFENYQTENHYNDLKSIINKALYKLPDIQRVVITLRDYEGYSYEEIGKITGLNESQVKVYIYRARVFLKSYLVDLDRVI